MTKKQNAKSLNELANSGNRFIVVAIDETYGWREDIAKKAGKIEGVYLIDLTKPTCLCELSVSYYGTFLRNYFHNVDKFDFDNKDAEMEYDNGGEDGRYFSGYSVFNVAKKYRSGKEDDVLEYERCNPSYC